MSEIFRIQNRIRNTHTHTHTHTHIYIYIYFFSRKWPQSKRNYDWVNVGLSKCPCEREKHLSLNGMSSVQFPSCVWLYNPMDCRTPGLPVHQQLPGFTQTHVHWVVMPSTHLILCHPLLSCLQSFPASGSFEMSQFFASDGQSFRVSASTSVLPLNTQDWYPLGWTGWISLQSKGPSRVFSNTTVQKHQFFGTQLSL